MSNPSGVIDLGALKAQQDIEREAVACGMADHHPLIVAMAPGDTGMAIQMVLVGTCATCYSMVRSDWWRKHAERHADEATGPFDDEEPSLAKMTQDKLDKMADDMRVPEERKL